MPILNRIGGKPSNRVYLYKDGVINNSIGGGISTNYEYYGSVTYNSDHILITGTYVSGSHFGRASIATVNTLDLSPYETLNVEYEITARTAVLAVPTPYFGVVNTRTFGDSYMVVSQPTGNQVVSTNRIVMPMSLFNLALSNKYLALYIDPAVSSGSVTFTIKVYKIWLEKQV